MEMDYMRANALACNKQRATERNAKAAGKDVDE